MVDSSPLVQLYLTRLREFYRQPARIFWVYGFPTVLAVVLGLAFNGNLIRVVSVDIVENAGTAALEQTILKTAREHAESLRPAVKLKKVSAEEGEKRISTGKSTLLIIPAVSRPPIYRFDPTRPEALAARDAFDDAYQRGLGRIDRAKPEYKIVDRKGSRYIDFLIPGLLGVNTMGGGLWGIGFLLVNFRIAKLLKRFRATPMPRRDFLLAILGARLTFLVPDVTVLLSLGVFMFGMPIRGSLGVFMLLEVVGALAFAGIGLLVASRAETTETVSGLMNLVMIPMWLCSGVFFSADRFPKWAAPLIQALPLTQLINALRAVLLEGAGLFDQVVFQALAILSVWAVGTFLLALRLFKWS